MGIGLCFRSVPQSIIRHWVPQHEWGAAEGRVSQVGSQRRHSEPFVAITYPFFQFRLPLLPAIAINFVVKGEFTSPRGDVGQYRSCATVQEGRHIYQDCINTTVAGFLIKRVRC